MRALSMACVALLAGSAVASAQETAAAPARQGQGGPLVIERVHTPLVIAPEYKVTAIDGDVGQLAGAYGGVLLDNQLLIGAAGYWLASGSHDRSLGYGGLLLGWSISPTSRIRFGGRGLVGVGSAELGRDLLVPTRDADPRLFARFGAPARPSPPPASTIRVRARDDFMVLEPQADAVTKVNDHIGVDVSVGYRWTAFDDGLRERIDGVTGSLALQLGW
jgi:hypothetical protein